MIRYQEMTRVPNSAPKVAGPINLRGQILTAIDLGQRLGNRPPGGEGEPTNVVVVRREDGAWSLLVDQIGDVREADHDDAFEPRPETIGARRPSVVSGVYKLEGSAAAGAGRHHERRADRCLNLFFFFFFKKKKKLQRDSDDQ